MPETAPVEELTFRAMQKSDADLALFDECFARNGSARSRERLRWQYANNPTGELFVDFAVPARNELAAIYASQPVRMRVGASTALGLQSVDTMTDKDFRGRGLFLKLAKRTYERAADAGAQLVYGFPNGSSAHGFFERLGWTNLDPIPFLIRPLRTSYLLERLKLDRFSDLLPNVPLLRSKTRNVRRGRIETITRFDESATRLWSAFMTNVRIAAERDAKYLNWRLFEKPHENYVVNAVRHEGEMRALVAYAVREKHGGRVGYIMESLCAPGWESELRTLLANALTEMLADRADAVLAWSFAHSPTFPSFLRCGFVPLPTRLRPIELHFGARGFDKTSNALVADRLNWYLSYLDSDTN